MEKKKFIQLRFVILFIAIAIISNAAYETYRSEKINKDYTVSFADITGSKNVQNNNIEKNRKPNDSLTADDSKKEKNSVSNNNNDNQHLPVPKGEVYTAEIDSYVPLLFIIALALIFYYSRSKKKSSH